MTWLKKFEKSAIHLYSGRPRPEQFPESGNCSDCGAIDRNHGCGTLRISHILLKVRSLVASLQFLAKGTCRKSPTQELCQSQAVTHPGTNIVHPCLTSKITFSQHEHMIHQVTRTDLGNRLVSVIYSRILVSMNFYFRYVNRNEHFDNVIYLKKNSCVVRVGKTCTDAIALYIDMQRKRGKS